MGGKANMGLMVVALLLNSATSGQAKKSYPLVLHFQNQVCKKLLNFDSSYSNQYGETFTIRNFRYYISHFSITATNGKKYNLPAAYYLIDERKPDSKTITLEVPFAVLKTICFEVGVDSTQNVSGVPTGALDPANGMFWTWNSGYIFAKLEGTSPQAKAPQNAFTYHIGGFRTGENAVRNVVLPLQSSLPASKDFPLVIIADINAWFDGIHPFKIADQPSIMTPGPAAMQVADNYSRMFRIMSNP